MVEEEEEEAEEEKKKKDAAENEELVDSDGEDTMAAIRATVRPPTPPPMTAEGVDAPWLRCMCPELWTADSSATRRLRAR